MVQGVFTRRRKTLENALLAFAPDDRGRIASAISRTGLDPKRRPETLELTEFVRLSDAF